MVVEGLVTSRSARGVAETIAAAKAEIAARSLTLFAEIDHAAGAETVGMSLRPLFLLIFGAAKGGTPLMRQAATAGIDLPLKLLIWQDEAGETQVAYNDPAWLAKRHGLGAEVEAPLAAISKLLRAIADAAA